jgi:hypothetical protein
MENFIQKIRLRRKIVFISFIAFIVIIALTFFIVTVADTLSIGRAVLGEERYSSRMNDSYLYSGIILLLTLPLLLPLNQFFKRYFETIKMLSPIEMERLKKQNETAFFFNKYIPAYIIKSKSIIFFKFFNNMEIQFMDITKIKIAQARGGFSIYFKTDSSFFYVVLSEKIESLLMIADYALEVNKNIVISFPNRR